MIAKNECLIAETLSGAMHQPARGAALLLRPQAAPPPRSCGSQVSSLQVCS